jgi:hypothetical protein
MNLSQPLPLGDRISGCFPQIPLPVFSSILLMLTTLPLAPCPTFLFLLLWYHPSPLPIKNLHRKLAYSYVALHPFSPSLVSPLDHLAYFILLLGAFIPGSYKEQLITSSRLSHFTINFPSPLHSRSFLLISYLIPFHTDPSTIHLWQKLSLSPHLVNMVMWL